MTIMIEVITFDSKADEKVLYRNSIYSHDDVMIDFDCLYKSLRILYLKSSHIRYTLSTK